MNHVKNGAGNVVSLFLFRFEFSGNGINFVVNEAIAADMYPDVDEQLKPLAHACCEIGCLKWLLAVDRFLDSRCQSRLSSAWWRSIFKEQGVIQARQLRAMEIFVSI